MEGAMDAIYKICEDVPEELDVDVPGLSERPINVFMPRMLQFFQSPHASLRKLALGCINQYIVVMPSALYMSMDQYLQGLFSLVKDPSADVRKLVCSAWVQLIEVRPSILEVAANPTGAVSSLSYVCQACASWNEIKSEGLHNEVSQILNGYKQMLGNGGWEQCMSTLEPAVVQRLSRYGV